MDKKKKKPNAAKAGWGQLLVQAAVDFLVGFLLLVIDHLME